MLEAKEGMLVEETVTLAIYGHGFAYNFVDVGKGVFAIPVTKSSQNIHLAQFV